MSRMRLTQQEADPIGAITAAPLVAIGAALAFVTSIVLTFAHWHEVGSPFAAVLGRRTGRGRGARRRDLGRAGARAVLGRAAVAGRRAGRGCGDRGVRVHHRRRRYIYDDFGPIVIGMLILSLAPFCSWVSLLLGRLLSAAVLSILIVGLVDVSGHRGAHQRTRRRELRGRARDVGCSSGLLLRDRR
jgi:hypothetical protein